MPPFKRNNKGGGQVCRDFQRGRCAYGTRCKLEHVLKDSDRLGKQDEHVAPALLALLAEKYHMLNSETSSINFSGLWKYEEVRMRPQNPFELNTLKGSEAVALCLQRNFPNATTVSFADNEITDPCNLLAALAKYGSNSISVLDLSANPIGETTFVSQLKSFRNLQTIRMNGCPCVKDPQQAGLLATLLIRELPWMLYLDDRQLTRPGLTVPWLKPTANNETAQGALEEFVSRLSSDVTSLYAPTAVFSLTMSPACKFEVPPVKGVPLQTAKSFQRFTQRLSVQAHALVRARSAQDAERASNVVIQGNQAINNYVTTAFNPKDTDDVALEITIVNAWTLPISPTQMMVNSAGSFSLTVRNNRDIPAVMKHYDRTIILCNGLITNDTWNIRVATMTEALWNPSMGSRLDRIKRNYAELPPLVIEEIARNSECDRMFELLVEVVAKTKLKVQPARGLLESVPNMDLSAAMETFESSKAQLSGDHFY